MKLWGLLGNAGWFVWIAAWPFKWKPWAAGLTVGFLIFIHPSHGGDAGLLAHELVHRRQFLRSWSLSGWRYLLSRRARLAYEVEAYRVQLDAYPAEQRPRLIELFAGFVADRYGLQVTRERARLLLTGP